MTDSGGYHADGVEVKKGQNAGYHGDGVEVQKGDREVVTMVMVWRCRKVRESGGYLGDGVEVQKGERERGGYLSDGPVEECGLILGVVLHGLVVVGQRLQTQPLMHEGQPTRGKQHPQDSRTHHRVAVTYIHTSIQAPDTDLATKLWGPARQLQRTADFLAATELRI